MERRYFHNLDGLRFIAASTVAISHLETLKQYRKLPFIKVSFFEYSADISVTFFFVLSGFLIMWWFLEETKGEINKIYLRSFYVNRISRTWPLYFLVVLLSISISLWNGTFDSDASKAKGYLCYLFFLPNTADVMFKRDIYLAPAWSLAVEEFFYFFFPLVLIRLKKEILIPALLYLSVLFIVIATVLNPVFFKIFAIKNDTRLLNYILIFFERYRIYSFLLGALAASLLYFKKVGFFKYFFYKVLIGLNVVGIAFFIFHEQNFSLFTHQLYSLLFALLLLLITSLNQPVYVLANKLFITGGKISYAIYMIHMFVILRLINQGSYLLQIKNKLVSVGGAWCILMGVTIVLSYFSFYFFENPLRLLISQRLLVKKEKI